MQNRVPHAVRVPCHERRGHVTTGCERLVHGREVRIAAEDGWGVESSMFQ